MQLPNYKLVVHKIGSGWNLGMKAAPQLHLYTLSCIAFYKHQHTCRVIAYSPADWNRAVVSHSNCAYVSWFDAPHGCHAVVWTHPLFRFHSLGHIHNNKAIRSHMESYDIVMVSQHSPITLYFPSLAMSVPSQHHPFPYKAMLLLWVDLSTCYPFCLASPYRFVRKNWGATMSFSRDP